MLPRCAPERRSLAKLVCAVTDAPLAWKPPSTILHGPPGVCLCQTAQLSHWCCSGLEGSLLHSVQHRRQVCADVTRCT